MGRRTVLCQDVDRLFYEEFVIEDDESERKWQNIVAGAHSEEIANSVLWQD